MFISSCVSFCGRCTDVGVASSISNQCVFHPVPSTFCHVICRSTFACPRTSTSAPNVPIESAKQRRDTLSLRVSAERRWSYCYVKVIKVEVNTLRSDLIRGHAILKAYIVVKTRVNNRIRRKSKGCGSADAIESSYDRGEGMLGYFQNTVLGKLLL